MKPLLTMRGALSDPDLFGCILEGETWRAWRVLLIAALGEMLHDDERQIFQSLTGRDHEPLQIVETFVAIVGRRGGKSRAAAVLATFIAALCDNKEKVVPGEKPLVLCLAQNQKQAAVVYSYVCAIFEAIPALRKMVKDEFKESLILKNGVSIEVRPASFRGLRGVTALAVICDESCFWYSDETSRNADSETIAAVRPSLATTGGPLILISSPYSRRGETWELYRKHYGPTGDPLILVAQGASRDFNPSLSMRVVERALENDPDAAAAEYLGQWRSDIEGFLTREAVEVCVSPGLFERLPSSQNRYFGFCDPSGGSSDSFTVCVTHKEKSDGVIVVDCLREFKPPFQPTSVVLEIAALLKFYKIHRVRGDAYSAEWVREAFRSNGIEYDVSDKNRSELYQEMLPRINSRQVDLLDNRRLISQLVALERRVSRNGRILIDHAPGSHDDVANATAGAIEMAAGKKNVMQISDEMLRRARMRSRTPLLGVTRY